LGLGKKKEDEHVYKMEKTVMAKNKERRGRYRPEERRYYEDEKNQRTGSSG